MTASISAFVIDPRELADRLEQRSTTTRSASVTLAFGTATVMLMPTCAGVFGMARTIAWPVGNAASRVASRTPAAIERMTVSGDASGLTCGSASAIDCGFTASTMIL